MTETSGENPPAETEPTESAEPAEPAEPAESAEVSDAALAAAETAAEQVEQLTPTQSSIDKAAATLKHLFEVMGIKRVISVDDAYEGDETTLLELAAPVAVLGDERAASFAGRFDLTEEEEVWRAEIHEAWEGAGDKERRLLLAAAHKQSGTQDVDEWQLDVSHLDPLLAPSGVVFEVVRPADWRRRLQSVVMEAETTPTLILFDQDMGARGNEGVRFAEKVFQEDAHRGLYVALLTRKVDRGQEVAHWRTLTKAHQRLDRDRFVVISKEHLGPDPRTFPDAIKIVLMAKPMSALGAAIEKVVSEATVSAKHELDTLSPDDFQKIVVKASISEGVWEAESLLRIYQLMMRKHVRAELYAKDVVKTSAEQIRRLVVNEDAEQSTSEMAVTLARSEYYEDGQFVNGVHLPVELGDLFTSHDTTYVLVEQPCDLMVRKNGERTPDLHDAIMLEVHDTKPRQLAQGFELPFHRNAQSSWVHFSKYVQVPIRALDLTVFNTDGSSCLDLDLTTPPAGLWPAWAARHKKLLTKFTTVKKHSDSLNTLRADNKIAKELHTTLIERLLHVDSASGRAVKGAVDGSTVKFELQRVGRLQPSVARALLLQFSLHRARDANEYPLAGRGGA